MSKPFGGVVTLTGSPISLAEGIGATVEGEIYTVHTLILRAGTDNSDDVYIGGEAVSGTTDTWMILEAGDSMSFDLPAGDYVSLENIYSLGTSNDTVYVFAIQ